MARFDAKNANYAAVFGSQRALASTLGYSQTWLRPSTSTCSNSLNDPVALWMAEGAAGSGPGLAIPRDVAGGVRADCGA